MDSEKHSNSAATIDESVEMKSPVPSERVRSIDEEVNRLLFYFDPVVHAVAPDNQAYLVIGSITSRHRISLYRYFRKDGVAIGPLTKLPAMMDPSKDARGTAYVHFVIDGKDCGIILQDGAMKLNYGGRIGVPLRSI